MSEFLYAEAEDEDYSLGDTPPEINDDEPRRRPRPEPEPPENLTDDKFISEPSQSVTSKRYEKKAAAPLRLLAKRLAANPATVQDSAAVIAHGPDIARMFGDAAADNAQIRRAVDFISEGTTSPTIALAVGLVGLGAQLARNHEQALAPKPRRFRTRGGRTIETRSMGVNFGPALGLVTDDPDALTSAVFDSTDDKVRSIFSKWTVAR